MTDQSNRPDATPPLPGDPDGKNTTATGRGPQRRDNEPQLPPAPAGKDGDSLRRNAGIGRGGSRGRT